MTFCTCTDTKCPYHPSNHDQGCTLCIQKNLKLKEIPSCFFNDIDHPKPTKGWHYTPEQKQAALQRVSEIGLTAAAKETGISVASLMKWRAESQSSAMA